MQNLILVKKERIGKELVQAVNARDLHAELESKQDFSDWIKKRIADYGFVENQDYLLHKFMVQLPSGAKSKIDYIITLDMAKELGMLERNDKGRAIRRYFIEVEKQAQASTRHIDAVRSLLLLDSPSKWEKLYQDSFFIAIMNLHGQEFSGNKSTPSYCAAIIRRWIYEIVLPVELLHETNTCRGASKRHCWFTKDNGRSTLLSQISKVEMVARMSESRADFEANCARSFLDAPLQLSVFN